MDAVQKLAIAIIILVVMILVVWQIAENGSSRARYALSQIDSVSMDLHRAELHLSEHRDAIDQLQRERLAISPRKRRKS